MLFPDLYRPIRNFGFFFVAIGLCGFLVLFTNPHALRAQQSMKHLQNWTNGHNYHLF